MREGAGLEEVKLPAPRGEWGKARINAEFHLDPSKMDKEEADPLAEAQHKAILDQISRASAAELGIIQKNKAAAIDPEDDSWMQNKKTVEIVDAVYKRSQELFSPQVH